MCGPGGWGVVRGGGGAGGLGSGWSWGEGGGLHFTFRDAGGRSLVLKKKYFMTFRKNRNWILVEASVYIFYHKNTQSLPF